MAPASHTQRPANSSNFPARDEEYFEWIDVLETAANSKTRFAMLEVGAGYGRWACRGAVAARRRGVRKIWVGAVEAEPLHVQWAEKHFFDNTLSSDQFRIYPTAVAAESGTSLFYINQPGGSDPAFDAKEWYGQALTKIKPSSKGDALGTYCGKPIVSLENDYQAIEVEVVTLADILQNLDFLDLVDFDIQGKELEVIEASIELLNEKAGIVHIGTHGRRIEAELRKIFENHGWENRFDFECFSRTETQFGTISFQDGVQSWQNPQFPLTSRAANA